MSVQLAGFGTVFRNESTAGTRRLSAPAFDWIYLILIVLCAVGFSLDAWSHGTYGPDQSVLSEYHLLMYGSIAVLGAFLTYTGVTRMQAGASWRDALPAGFGIGFAGVLVFGVSGIIDLTGHALFGFETGVEARMSPSHIGLFVGLTCLRLALPLAAGARQRAGITQSWIDYVPTMLSVGLLFQLLFILLPERPMGQGVEWATQAARGAGDFISYDLGLSGMFLLTIVYVGLLVGVLRVVTLPVGSITLISVVPVLMMALQSGNLRFLPVWLAAGIVGDLVLLVGDRWIKDDAWTLRLFGLVVPLALWGAYFVSLILTNAGGGVWWSGYVWIGSVVQAAAVGFMIAVLATLPATAPAKGDL